jgi:putative nucleotidyltransferase with HDIG domain
MHSSGSQSRLFTGALDRAAFLVFFLGAVVPLVGMAVVMDRFALPSVENDAVQVALIAGLVSIGVLTLGSFLVLRQMMRRTLSRMNRDNERLSGLLEWSNGLEAAHHVTEVLAMASERAREMEDAAASYVFLKGDEDSAPSLVASAGPDADLLYTRHAGAIEELVRTASESRRPAMREARSGELAAAAVPLRSDAAGVGVLLVLKTGEGHIEPHEIDALSTLAGISAVALHNADLRDAQRNFFSHVTDMLVTALDSHLGFHHGHGQRVAQLSNRLGRAIGLDDDALQRLHFAALLHDIGMLKLDRNQQMSRATCEKHCMLGSRMLSRIRLWRELAPIVYHHHEWFDGTGYPESLAGAAIPLESRVIALCDAVDSMTSESSYRTPRSLDLALVELERCSGTQFDPDLVEAFIALARDGMIDIGPPPQA